MKFELFGRLKDKNKKSKKSNSNRRRRPSRSRSSGGGGKVPIQEVRNLSSQGYSENEIVNELRNRGYDHPDIKQALNKALKARTEGGNQNRPPSQGRQQGRGQGQNRSPQSNMPQALSRYEGEGGNRSMTGGPGSTGEMQQEPMEEESEGGGGWMPGFGGGSEQQAYEEEDMVPEDIEELIEVIVSEKLIDIEEEFDEVHSEMDELKEKVDEIQERLHEVEIRKDEDEKKFISKVNEMEDYLETSQSRIGGLEKALQQVLPSLVDNVRELTSLVQDMKEEKR